jgi:hypothetical protein
MTNRCHVVPPGAIADPADWIARRRDLNLSGLWREVHPGDGLCLAHNLDKSPKIL